MSVSISSLHRNASQGDGEKKDQKQTPSKNGEMLNMLAEVAAQTLRADKTPSPRKKKCKEGKPSGMPLRQARNLSGNQLVRTFSRFEGDEMRRMFSFQCLLLPKRCNVVFQSFGSEAKARNLIKDHLLTHLDDLPDGEVLQVPKQQREVAPYKKTLAQSRGQKKSKSLSPINGRHYPDINEIPIEAFGEVVIEGEPELECEEETHLSAERARLSPGEMLVSAPDHDYTRGPQDEICPNGEEYSAIETIWVKSEGGDTPFAGITDYEVSASNEVDQSILAVSNEVVVKTEEISEEEVKEQEDCTDPQSNIIIEYGEETSDNIEFIPVTELKLSGEMPVLQGLQGLEYGLEYHVERDEHREHKKPKGKAKFIGQSAAEKEMAVRMIESMKVRPGREPLECQICHPPRSFTAPTTLISHYRSHAGIKPYECHICGGVFTRQHSLNYHLLIHSNKTRFTCGDCGRKFRHPSHFKEHQRRHTGEAPFQCQDCDIRFKTRNTYKRHLKTRHGKVLTQSGGIIILSEEEFRRVRTAPRSIQMRVSSDKENTRRPRPKTAGIVRRKKEKGSEGVAEPTEAFIQKLNLNGDWTSDLGAPNGIEIEDIKPSTEMILQAVVGEDSIPTTVVVLTTEDILYGAG